MYTVVLKNGINFIIKAREMLTDQGCLQLIDECEGVVAIYPMEEILYAVKKDVQQ